MIALPIDPFIADIVAGARRSRAVVVTAAPGAGKTTRVPPVFIADGGVLLLQPRRVAARAIARRIAEERGWTIGSEVGWHVRFERRFTANTRLIVATEGVLTARLQQDPLLSGFHTIVLDEFHERSIHADLAIALARQAWLARSDLRIIVMSATMEAAAVAAFLGDCPVVSVPGRLHPLEISYAPGETVANAAVDLLRRTSGNVLCFLPGAYEIRQAVSALQGQLGQLPAADQIDQIDQIHKTDQIHHVAVIPLHGSLDGAAQDAALGPAAPGCRRIIVATNVAETSVTVPDVTAVVDSGLHKVARYDAERGIDSLETERITLDSADQRAGRAGRIAPGIVVRLWEATARLRPHREPEIHRIDLAGTALDVMAWGGAPLDFDWFEAPRPDALESAIALIERLGAAHDGKLTVLGRTLQRLSLHPRLARMLVAANGDRSVIRACALLSERHFVQAGSANTSSDLLSALDQWRNVPPHVERAAREIESVVEAAGLRTGNASPLEESGFRRAILAGYPDRVAQRREPGSPRVRLASGAGGVIGPESGVREGEFVVAIDVRTALGRVGQIGRVGQVGQVGRVGRVGASGAVSTAEAVDNRIRIASRVEREWLEPNATAVVHRFDATSGTIRAVSIDRYDALILKERTVAVDPETAAGLLADAWLALGPRGKDVQLLRRLKFAGHAIDIDRAVRAAAYGSRSLVDVDLAGALPPDLLNRLTRDAPESLIVPSGRAVALEYGDDGSVTASVKLQELFGLADTPIVGPGREPVRFALLAPNGRPVQVTRDLRSFWERTYPQVRKELRGRYPRHPWPEDPWTAVPTARTTRRRPT